MYTPVLGQSPLIDELFQRLCEKVRHEIAFQKELARVLGSLQMVFARSSTSGPASAAAAAAATTAMTATTTATTSRVGSPVAAGLL